MPRFKTVAFSGWVCAPGPLPVVRSLPHPPLATSISFLITVEPLFLGRRSDSTALTLSTKLNLRCFDRYLLHVQLPVTSDLGGAELRCLSVTVTRTIPYMYLAA